MRTMLSVLLTIFAGYLLICLLAYVLQSRLVFFPDRNVSLTPAAVNLDYEDIRFQTQDGIGLHGWYIPTKNPSGTLLFFHGNAGNISHRLSSIRIFHELALNVFIFDYRGYGKSEGSIDEAGSYLDARAAWDYLTQQKNTEAGTIIIFGRSLGSAVAAYLGRQKRAAGIILESSFRSIPELGQQLYPFLPVKLLSRIEYPTSDYLRDIMIPKLIIHSREDEIIPFSHGIFNFGLAPEPKTFLELSGGHNDGFWTSRHIYQAGIRDFLKNTWNYSRQIRD